MSNPVLYPNHYLHTPSLTSIHTLILNHPPPHTHTPPVNWSPQSSIFLGNFPFTVPTRCLILVHTHGCVFLMWRPLNHRLQTSSQKHTWCTFSKHIRVTHKDVMKFVPADRQRWIIRATFSRNSIWQMFSICLLRMTYWMKWRTKHYYLIDADQRSISGQGQLYHLNTIKTIKSVFIYFSNKYYSYKL